MPDSNQPRHSATVRVTHWVAAACFVAFLISGAAILTSHPRFYWGETGNVEMEPAFTIPVPSSRGSVKTGYDFVLKDMNSWARSLHFQTAWLGLFTALVYVVWGWRSGHFRKQLWPGRLRWGNLLEGDAHSYNAAQRVTYLGVVFGLFPVMIWTGLAMSPAFTAAFPFVVEFWGGQQSARTVHFFATVALVLFLVGHVVMVWRAGFLARTRAMITGREDS